MMINTKRFGEIEADEDRLFLFKEGLPGFEEYTKFILIRQEEGNVFLWLQSMEEPGLAFVLMSPFLVVPDYNPEISEQVLEELKAVDVHSLLLLVVTVIPKDISRMTANFAAPILLNNDSGLGKQVILETGEYKIRQPFFENLRSALGQEA